MYVPVKGDRVGGNIPHNDTGSKMNHHTKLKKRSKKGKVILQWICFVHFANLFNQQSNHGTIWCTCR